MYQRNTFRAAGAMALILMAAAGKDGSKGGNGGGKDDPPPPSNAPTPTRTDLDTALAALPGDYKDPDYVVTGMRASFGELFTAEDEAKVRALVKADPPPPAAATVTAEPGPVAGTVVVDTALQSEVAALESQARPTFHQIIENAAKAAAANADHAEHAALNEISLVFGELRAKINQHGALLEKKYADIVDAIKGCFE